MFNFILIGKSGSGKSSTGNSILLQSAFEVSSKTSGSKNISHVVLKTGIYNGCNVSVIDGLDICSYGENADFSKVDEAVNLLEKNITLFLILVKYGERFTDESRKVIQMTKNIFGNNVISKFSILIVTHGDNFKYDTREGDVSYQLVEEWLESQSGDLKELYNETNRRAVLFDNRTKVDAEKKEQIKQLHNIIKSMNKVSYTTDNYKEAEVLRNSLKMKSDILFKNKDFEIFNKQIRDELHFAIQSHDTEHLERILDKISEYARELNQTFGENSKLTEEIKIKIDLLFKEVTYKLESNKTEKKSIQDKRFSDKKEMHISENDVHGHNEASGKTTLYDDKHAVIDFSGRQNEKEPLDLKDQSLSAGLPLPDKKDLNSLLILKNNAEKYLIIIYREIEDLEYSNANKEELEKIKNEISRKLNVLQHNESAVENKKIKLMENVYKENRFESVKGAEQSEIVLLLIGSAGKGKSSTGNSIVGENFFKINNSTSSKLNSVNPKKCVNIEGKRYAVVDGPTIDIEQSHHSIVKLHEAVENALSVCNFTFSALIFVLIYGERFTKQEHENIKFIKNVLGQDVIKKYGICILTKRGDIESDENELINNFHSWCKQQQSEIKELFEECRHRCVLFDNRAKDASVKQRQLRQLLNLVSTDKPYSFDEYQIAQQAAKDRELSKRNASGIDLPIPRNTEKDGMDWSRHQNSRGDTGNSYQYSDGRKHHSGESTLSSSTHINKNLIRYPITYCDTDSMTYSGMRYQAIKVHGSHERDTCDSHIHHNERTKNGSYSKSSGKAIKPDISKEDRSVIIAKDFSDKNRGGRKK